MCLVMHSDHGARGLTQLHLGPRLCEKGLLTPASVEGGLCGLLEHDTMYV